MPEDMNEVVQAAQQGSTMLVQYGDDAPLEARLSPDQELHQKLLTKLKARRNMSRRHMSERYEEWDRVREHMRLYIDLKRLARKSDRTSIPGTVESPFQRAVTIPMSYAHLHVMLTQAMSIYAARTPMIQVAGTRGEDMFRAQLLEAVLEYDANQMKLYSVLFSAFQEAFLFGNGYLYDSWEIEHSDMYRFEPLEVPGTPPDVLSAVLGPLAYTPIRTFGVKREYSRWLPVSCYDMRIDPRLPQWRCQEGEFMGHRWIANPNKLILKSGDRGPYFNTDKLPKHSHTLNDDEYGLQRGVDPINPQYIEGSIDYASEERGFLRMETMVWELIPREHGLGTEDYPQKWVFTWAEDQVIIRAHPLINKHQNFPYSVLEADPDFHSTYAPGIIESIEPLQRFVNWLFNSHVENVVQMLNNQYVYSPQFIESMDLEFGGPGEHIRMTQEAVDAMLSGEISDVRSFFFQVPVQDVTGSSYMNAVQYIYQMSQVMTGVNDPLSGIQLPTERSATEVSTIAAKATDRLAVMVRLMDENGIKPTVERTMSNRQQFTTMERYFRIVGRLAEYVGEDSLFITLDDIQGEYDYRAISGILPEDPARSATALTNLLSTAGQLPQLMEPGPDGRALDFRKIFNKIAEKNGLQDIDDYYMDVQVAPPEQVEAGVEQGDLVPMGG
jgi:hypothetical protein